MPPLRLAVTQSPVLLYAKQTTARTGVQDHLYCSVESVRNTLREKLIDKLISRVVVHFARGSLENLYGRVGRNIQDDLHGGRREHF